MDIQTPAGPQGTQLATAQLTQEAVSHGVFLGVNMGAGAGGRAKVQGDHFVGPPPCVTEDRRAQDSPTLTSARDRFLSNLMGSGVRPIHGKGTTSPPKPPHHLREPPSACAHKGENPFLFHSLGQNGRHRDWRGKPGAGSEQINKSKSANGRPARAELVAKGPGRQEEEEARLRDGGRELKREPSLAPSGGKSIPGDKPIETQPHTRLATTDLILRLPLSPETQELA